MENPQPYCSLNNGIQMPLLGLGVYDMYGKEAEHAIGLALETGYRLIDTAAMYGNEKEVGNAVRSSGLKREEVFVTTKVNNPDHGYEATLRAFDHSRQLLQIDYIDLYLVHWPVQGKRKDTWKALEHLYAQKQVRAIGVANYLLPFLDELESYATVVPALNQVEFSPFLFLKDLLHRCRRQGIRLQSYTPLTKGEKLQDPRLLELSRKYGKSPAQMILRWNIEHGVSTIPKSANPARIKENFSIFDFTITEEDMQLMDSLDEHYRVQTDPMVFL